MLNKTKEDGEKVDVNNIILDEPITEEIVSTDEVIEEQAAEEVVEETPEIEPDLDTEDWMGKLNEGEVFNSAKGPAPRLHGLRRLAKPFILKEESKVNQLIIVPREHIQELTSKNGDDDVMSVHEEIATHNFPMASVTFNITLKDGRTFSDSADAFYSNCEELALFPTAVASARAEARCLRKVLGITAHAAEEIVDKDAGEELAPDDDSPIKAEQAKLIDKILTGLELSLKELLEGITTREVFSVEKLTTGEARKALRILNDLKKKAKKKGKKL
tara:strand:- start:3131 stop:3952 length:822 start_codon:yes stop_codon:yes gene_type:complete